jgi:dTDP-4-amino-4,6-dideoxygalactose transaminase
MQIPFVDLRRQHAALAPLLDERILEVAHSGRFILGENVAALEEATARYLGVDHAVACGSGTDALHLALAALGIGSGDEVITTPFTFAATIEAIEYLGATPVLVDIEPSGYNIDPARIEAAITDRTRALLPVHLFGLPADMDRIGAIARDRGLMVVEDCAQSLGARLDGQPAGSLGDAAALSFYPTKTLGCFGDGGMVVTRDASTDRRLRELRNHGIGPDGQHLRLGYNSRLDEVQAAVVRLKLEKLDEMNERRRQIAEHYNRVLAEAGAVIPTAPSGSHHVYGYYTILVPDRQGLRKSLQEAGVATAIYYDRPLHKHPYFSRSCRFEAMPVAERVAGQCVSLPMFPEMTDEEMGYVAETTARLIG